MNDASSSRGGNGVSKQNTSEATADLDGDHTRGSRGGSGLEGPDKVRKLFLKRIGQLHRAYAELHQITAQRELDENKARTSEVIAEKQGVVRWPQLGLQSTTILRAAAQGAGEFAGSKIDKCGKAKGQEQKVKVYSSLQGTLWAPAVKIPYHERIPAYKAWSYLMSNELATEVGARIFYTDATGETIPASDSEDEDRKGEGNLEGAHRESEEWVMRQLAAERGVTFEVVDALAQRLDAANSVVEARLTALLAEQKEQKDLGIGAVSSVRMGVEKCTKSFCRRCRIYNCVTHISGGDVRPHHRLPASETIEEVPCGPHCWRVVQRAVSEPLKAGTTSDPASHAVLGSQHQQQPGQELTHETSLPPGVILREQVTLLDTPARPRRIRGAIPSVVALGASSTSSGVLDGVLHAASNGEGVGDAAIHCPRAGTDWNAFELDALQYCRKIYMGDACRTARYIGTRKCSEVQAMMEDVPELSTNAPSSPPLGPARRVGSKRKPAAPQRRKNAAQVVNKRAKHDMTKPWPRYTPCTCVGPCNAECSCAKSKNFCEKFCACGPSCTIRFVGCDCKSGCRTKACPCFAAGHECDPDLCIGCTKSCACNNMRLRFRQHKHVSMGKSDIAGWGSFLLEAAKKGDLVGEYTGELVTQTEADRRGKAYDRDDNSYLFNLNEEWVIDARRRGNKLRFANHSTDPNCAAKILMVDGDHRVGIYACKDILPGTELFYDYCYQPDQAPVWAQLK